MDKLYPVFGGMFHLLPAFFHCYLLIPTIRAASTYARELDFNVYYYVSVASPSLF